MDELNFAGATLNELDEHRWYAYFHLTLADGTPYTHVIWVLPGDGLASGSEEDYRVWQDRN